MDEEFSANASELVFKKSYADIMTTQEFWQWVYGPLVAAVFSSETSDEPAPMLFSNICSRPPGAVKRP